MQYHPEVVKLQEKANNMDPELLNDLLATDGEKQVHMEQCHLVYDEIH